MKAMKPMWHSTAKYPTSQKLNCSTDKMRSEKEPNLNWEWYNPPVESIPVEFCLETTLHGLKYLGEQNRHICERLFWLAAFVASVFSAAALIWTMWKDYTNMPIVTVLNPTYKHLDEIPFPSVTICNANNIQKSKLKSIVEKGESHMHEPVVNVKATEEYLRTLATFADVNHICDSASTFLDRLVRNTTIDESFSAIQKLTGKIDKQRGYNRVKRNLRKVSQPCEEMILHCIWQNEIQNCSELFQPIDTDHGFCCTFNTMPISKLLKNSKPSRATSNLMDGWRVDDWNTDKLDYETLLFTDQAKDRKFPRRGRSAGRSSGLSILLYPDLDEYYCTNTDSEGYTMGINVPLDFPRMKEYSIPIATDSEVFIGVRPEITMSDKSLKRFPKDERKCYYGNEFNLQHYTMYTISNCRSECIARNVLLGCGCVHYYMPHGQNDMLCEPQNYKCAEHVKENISKVGLTKICTECLPTCEEIDFHTHVSVLGLQKKKVERVFHELSTTHDHADVSIVHVYFNSDSVRPKLRKEMMTLIQLISNAGGLLGLCLGFSVFSLLEICYYGTIRLFCSWYRKKAIRQLNSMNDKNGISVPEALPAADKKDDVCEIFRVSNRRHVDTRFEDSIEEQIQRAFIKSFQQSEHKHV